MVRNLYKIFDRIFSWSKSNFSFLVQETLIRVKAIETFINVLVAVFLLIGTYKVRVC